MSTSGIYVINCNKSPENYYVGSTVNFESRFGDHAYDLSKNRHKSRYLQSVYNKYGKDSVKFYILEYVKDLSKLLDREDYYLQDWFWFDDERDCNFS